MAAEASEKARTPTWCSSIRRPSEIRLLSATRSAAPRASRLFGSTAYCPIETGMPPGSEVDAFCLGRAGDNEPSQAGSLPPMIDSHGLYLLIAAATSVVVLILLIAVVKLNPFISLPPVLL